MKAFARVARRAGALVSFALLCVTALSAQDHPRLTVDEDCPAFAFAPDGRIVYAVQHVFKTKQYDLERDDIWIVSPEGKRVRIVNGEKLVKATHPFSYGIQSLSWSPDGRRFLAQMLTNQVISARGDTLEGELADLFESDGREINIAGLHDNSAIPEAFQAVWLSDGETVVFLSEAVKPKLLYEIAAVRPIGGRGGSTFAGHVFSAVSWDPARNSAVAIERDKTLTGPIRLVQLDLVKETRRELVSLGAFLGQLTVSPSGTKVAYFRDGDTLEVRDLASPDHATQVTVAYGRFAWSADERRILLKRGPERHSGDLVWVSLADGKLEPALHGLVFRDFQLSPDGRSLGVTQPGKRSLMVYSLP
jgi:dipeptidyl aminopeptidase/acylaminoacyl peptidase